MNNMKMILTERIIPIFFISTIIIATLMVPRANSQNEEPGDDQKIPERTPFDYAVEIGASFESLNFLEYGRQCANPHLIKSNVEYLLTFKDLNMDTIQESQTLYKRWDQYGGYRCDPSRFICMRERPHAEHTLYKCHCPLETEDFQESYNSLIVGLGKQKVKKVTDSEGKVHCEFENIGYGEKIPFELKEFPLEEVKDTAIISESNMPKPPTDEIICGIFHKQIFTNVYTNATQFTIDTGLFFNNISCPNGLKCLMREFLVDCTRDNAARIQSDWIDLKDRTDRRAHWPLCTCVDSNLAVGSRLPAEDPIENKILEMFTELSKAGLGQECDSTEYDTAKRILDSNWYLYPPGAIDDMQKIHDRTKTKGGVACVESKGLICDTSNTKKCICRRTPQFPGFTPEFPTSVNSKGYCQLDTNSDCHFNVTRFQCRDGENCLVHEWDFECSEKSIEYAWKQLEDRALADQVYLARCRCTNAKIKKMPSKGSGMFVCAWKMIFAFVFVNFVRVKTL